MDEALRGQRPRVAQAGSSFSERPPRAATSLNMQGQLSQPSPGCSASQAAWILLFAYMRHREDPGLSQLTQQVLRELGPLAVFQIHCSNADLYLHGPRQGMPSMAGVGRREISVA